MTESRVQRRLAAILAADVVGYSRLMRQDESGTLAALKSRRLLVLNPVLAQHGGRIVKVMGDGVLVEFASAVDAVKCAIEIQKGFTDANLDIAKSQQIILRIGINLGDVIVEGSDIYGDSVNIAARLETLSEPGGICLSASVYDQVHRKLPLSFEDLGPQQLKNIAEPVLAYRVLDATTASTGTTANDGRVHSGNPIIAILPFTNMSAEPEQEYFSDGITEDIITELSRFRSLDVIARHSSFAFKGKSLTVQQIGRELGADYVLEGSVRRSGNRLRITAQLIDAKTSSHIWAERLDRDSSDLFEMQDEVTQRIVTTIADRLERSEQVRVASKRPEAMRAYDYILQARSIISDTAAANLRSRSLYEKALEIEPNNVLALIGISGSHLIDLLNRWTSPQDQILARAEEFARKALAIDGTDYRVHLAISSILMRRRLFEEALAHSGQAMSLNPNDADGCAYFAMRLLAMGRFTEALTWMRKATHLNPVYPAWYLYLIGEAHYGEREYEKAIGPLKAAAARFPSYITPRRHLAAAYGQLGRLEDARAEVATLLKLDRDVSISLYRDHLLYQRTEDRDHYLDGLRKAGLPE